MNRTGSRWAPIIFFFQAEDGIRDYKVTGVQTCALPISTRAPIIRLYLRIPRWRKRWGAGGCRRIRSRRCSRPLASRYAEVSMRRYIAISSVLLFAACYHGPSIYKFGPVQGPEGVDTDLH